MEQMGGEIPSETKTQGSRVCVICPFKQRKIIAYYTCNQGCVCVYFPLLLKGK